MQVNHAVVGASGGSPLCARRTRSGCCHHVHSEQLARDLFAAARAHTQSVKLASPSIANLAARNKLHAATVKKKRACVAPRGAGRARASLSRARAMRGALQCAMQRCMGMALCAIAMLGFLLEGELKHLVSRGGSYGVWLLQHAPSRKLKDTDEELREEHSVKPSHHQHRQQHQQRRRPPSAAINCTELVQPVDVHPVRSPQVVHSAITRHIANRSLVEIGTRDGDGIACFARAASSAVAIEMDPTYCKRLEDRARVASADGRPMFTVRCGRYQEVAMDDAEVFTWWQQLPDLANVALLRHLRQQQLAQAIRPDAVAIVLFEHGFPDDAHSFQALRNFSSWSEVVPFDERALCKRKLPRKPWFHNRAHGSFRVVGIRVADLRL